MQDVSLHALYRLEYMRSHSFVSNFTYTLSVNPFSLFTARSYRLHPCEVGQSPDISMGVVPSVGLSANFGVSSMLCGYSFMSLVVVSKTERHR